MGTGVFQIDDGTGAMWCSARGRVFRAGGLR
jgi:hypothetical protein